MEYTNSSLITYTDLSPNFNKRREGDAIDRFTIHHMAGSYDVKACGALFHRKMGSSNYGVDTKDIALFVEEKNRSWCSSNYQDYRAITVECQNTPLGVQTGSWEIAPETYNNLIRLAVDVSKRYGKTKVIEISDEIENLGWSNAKDRVAKQTAYANNYVVPEGSILLTQHIYFDTTLCPGPYIRSIWKKIANDIQMGINGQPYTPPTPSVNVAKPPLYKGCRGNNTKLLQQNLMAVGIALPKYGADGDFGDETRSGVIAFQKMVFPNEPKEWDGIYGNKSYNKMNSLLNRKE